MANELIPYCNAAGAIVGFGTAFTVLDECDGTTTTSTVYLNTNGISQGTALPAGWGLCSQCCPDHSVEIVCWTRVYQGTGLLTSEIALVKTIETDGSITVSAFYLDGTKITPTPNFTELHSCPANGVTSLSASGTALTFVNELGVSVTIDLCDAIAACGGGGGTDSQPSAVNDVAQLATGVAAVVNLGANDTPGNSPNTYTYVSGTVPPGMTLAANGILSGTPSTAGTYVFRYRITDTDGDTAEANVTVTVSADISPVGVDDTFTIDACVAAVRDLLANDTKGNLPASVVYVSGTVPPGMTFQNGTLTGTPTTPGTYTFTYRITDADGDTDDATVQVTVSGVAAGCTTQIIGDDFNSGMGAWTEVYGDVFSNAGGAVQNGVGRHNTTVGANDMWAECTVRFNDANPTDVYMGPNVRMDATGNNRYWMETEYANDTVVLYKMVGGVQTALDTAAVSIPAPGSAVFKLEVEGTTLRGYVNGILVLGPVTDSSLTGPQYAGFTVATQAGHDVEVDDFSAGTCSGTVGTCSGTTPTGKFTINQNGNILDPCGNPWRPIGGNVIAKPTSVDETSGYWAPSNYEYANGKAATFAAAGWNAVELQCAVPDPLAPFTMAEALAGLSEVINEYTALGIVCIVYGGLPGGGSEDWGYNPATYADVPATSRQIQTYLCQNHNGNEYVWLSTLLESHSWMGSQAQGSGNTWAVANTGAYDDAIARGWTGMQVFVLPSWGQDIEMAANSPYASQFLSGKQRSVLGWHNFGSAPTVAEIRTLIQAIKGRNLPIICTSFGQNWADGDPAYGGDNPGTEPVGVDFTFQYGFSEFQTGGIAWIPGGHLDAENVYGWRYSYNNGGIHRGYSDTAEGWNEVGLGMLNAGAQNNGGGAATLACAGTGGGGGGGGGGTPSTPSATNDSFSGTVGQAFSKQVGQNDTAGTTPSTWAVTSGSLPPGLAMASNGTITGTPTTAGSYTATYRITDANGATSSATVAIVISAVALNGPVLTDDVGVEEFVIGTAHSFWPGWNDNLGVEPSTFAVISGSLPPGLAMDGDGFVSGTPTTAGTYTATYRVTDLNGNTDDATMSIIIPATTGGGGGSGGGSGGGGTGNCGDDFTTQFSTNGGASSNGLYDIGGSVHGATMPLQVSGGRARAPQLSDQYIDCFGLHAGHGANQYAEGMLIFNGNYQSAYSGVVVRAANGVGGWQWAWFGCWYGNQSQWRLIFINNYGIAAEYYWNAPGGILPGSQHRLRLEAVGNAYTCYADGVQIGSVNTSAIAQIGDPGLTVANHLSLNETEFDWLSTGSLC